jgi:Ca2+:H+ antiporter
VSGEVTLAVEVALRSSAQVAAGLIPALALLSWLLKPLPLAFRPVELGAVGAATIVVAITVADGRSRRWEGFALLALYAVVVVVFGFAGDRG